MFYKIKCGSFYIIYTSKPCYSLFYRLNMQLYFCPMLFILFHLLLYIVTFAISSVSDFFDLPCEIRWLGSDCWLLICLGMKARNKLTSQATFPPLNPSVSYCASFLVKQRDYKEM